MASHVPPFLAILGEAGEEDGEGGGEGDCDELLKRETSIECRRKKRQFELKESNDDRITHPGSPQGEPDDHEPDGKPHQGDAADGGGPVLDGADEKRNQENDDDGDDICEIADKYVRSVDPADELGKSSALVLVLVLFLVATMLSDCWCRFRRSKDVGFREGRSASVESTTLMMDRAPFGSAVVAGRTVGHRFICAVPGDVVRGV